MLATGSKEDRDMWLYRLQSWQGMTHGPCPKRQQASVHLNVKSSANIGDDDAQAEETELAPFFICILVIPIPARQDPFPCLSFFPRPFAPALCIRKQLTLRWLQDHNIKKLPKYEATSSHGRGGFIDSKDRHLSKVNYLLIYDDVIECEIQ